MRINAVKIFKIFLVTICLYVFNSAEANSEPLKFPMSFHATFDNTLNAQAIGDGKPVKTKGKVQFRPGKVGQALLCGEGGAEVFYKTARNLSPEAGTLEMWVCPINWTGQEDTFHVFLEAKDPGWLVFYRYYKRGIMTLLGENDKNYRYTTSMKFKWKPGEWHHLAATWKSTGLEAYIDGKRVGLSANPPMPEKLPEIFMLGDAPWGMPRNQQTLIDEVKIYSTVLDSQSIEAAAKGKAINFKPQISSRVDVNPQTDTLTIFCDAAGLVNKTTKVKVEISQGKSGKPLISGQTSTFKQGIGKVDLSLKTLSAGTYHINVNLMTSSSKIIANDSFEFIKPGPPVWRDKCLGENNTVLPPWTPLSIKTDKKTKLTVDCLGRSYTFGMLPESIISEQTELLHSPVKIKAIVNGQEIELCADEKCQLEIEKTSDAEVVFKSKAAQNKLKVQAINHIEYDGYIWTDLAITPNTLVTIDKLTIEWSMPLAVATLMHVDFGDWAKNQSRKIPSNGFHSGFAPFFWVGNENKGLSWFTESTRNWHIGKNKNILNIIPKGKYVNITLEVISKPIKISKSLDYGFGMMATPIRPRPENARKWRMRPATNETFDVVWPNNYAKYFGFPEAKNPANFAAWVKNAHEQRKVKVLPYINLNNVSAGVPEWIYYKSDWEDPSRTCAWPDVAAMGYASMGTCPASSDWQDYILYHLSQMIDRYRVDGFYIDCWAPYPCKADKCGWHDEQGKIHSKFPIRAYRKIIKRLRTMMHAKGIDPFIMVHNSAQMITPMMSFADTYLDGEQFRNTKLKDDYLEVMPPDTMRTEFSRNWGTVGFFLPELHNEYHTSGTPNLAAYLLLHDIIPWQIFSSQKILERFFKAYDKFGIDKAGFQPYWEGNNGVKTADQILVSAFTRPESALLAIMNTGDALQAELKLNPAQLKMSRISTGVDVYTGQHFELTDNIMTVPFQKHQGRVIRLYKDPVEKPILKKYSPNSILLKANQAEIKQFGSFTPKLVEDSMSIPGTAVMQPGNKYLWSVQWSKLELNKLKKDTGYIFRIHCRLDKSSNNDNAVRFGFYDYLKKSVTSSKTVPAKDIPDNEYIWIEAGKILPDTKGYIFSAPWTNKNINAIYIDALELIPEDEYCKK